MAHRTWLGHAHRRKLVIAYTDFDRSATNKIMPYLRCKVLRSKVCFQWVLYMEHLHSAVLSKYRGCVTVLHYHRLYCTAATVPMEHTYMLQKINELASSIYCLQICSKLHSVQHVVYLVSNGCGSHYNFEMLWINFRELLRFNQLHLFTESHAFN